MIILPRHSMEIKAVKFRKDGFYTQPFVMGGEDGAEKFDKNIRYRGSLQNYLIDTGNEVILVDTGLPAGTPEEVPDENTPLYTGKDICSYMDAFKALGYDGEKRYIGALYYHRCCMGMQCDLFRVWRENDKIRRIMTKSRSVK